MQLHSLSLQHLFPTTGKLLQGNYFNIKSTIPMPAVSTHPRLLPTVCYPLLPLHVLKLQHKMDHLLFLRKVMLMSLMVLLKLKWPFHDTDLPTTSRITLCELEGTQDYFLYSTGWTIYSFWWRLCQWVWWAPHCHSNVTDDTLCYFLYITFPPS